jgi:hypothetical protein
VENIEPFFLEFAEAFRGNVPGNGDIAFPDHLARDALDYSLDSLRVVDDYLTHLHDRNDELTELESNNTILWGGAYVGEVIRRNGSRPWGWIDYDDYMPHRTKLKALIPERNICTCAFLASGPARMTMPLNKIARFIHDGSENSVHFYASCDIADDGSSDDEHDA